MCKSEKLSASDAGNFNLGESPSKSLCLVMALAAFELKCHTFRATKLIEHLCRHGGTLHEWSAHGGRRPVVEEKDFGELNLAVDFAVELLNIKLVALLDAILLSAGLEYCVGHCFCRKDGKCSASGKVGGEFTTGFPGGQEIFAKVAAAGQGLKVWIFPGIARIPVKCAPLAENWHAN